MGQLRYFSMPKVSLQSCPMDPLGYPIPPLLPTAVLPCGLLRTGQVGKPQRGKQRGNRTSPGCGLKDIKTGTQRQIQHGLRALKPCPAPGPPPPTPSLLTGLSLPLQDSSPRCPALCPAGRPPPQTVTHPRLPSFPSFLFPGAAPSLPAGFLGPQISRASRTTTTTTANRTLEQLEELFSAEASLPLLE